MLGINTIDAQYDERERLENLKYYASSLKSNVEGIRYYTDSTEILQLIDQIEVLVDSLQSVLDNIVLPQDENIIEDTIMEDEVVYDTDSWGDYNSGGDAGPFGNLTKLLPKNRFKTKFFVDFGINTIMEGSERNSTLLYPDVNVGKSWFWNFGLINNQPLGKANAKAYFKYGVTYLLNRFSFENDVRLTSVDKASLFVNEDNLVKDPKLNIGTITVPLSIGVHLSKNIGLEVGGFAGYRVRTVQKLSYKAASEKIYTERYSSHNLSDLIYGINAGIELKGLSIYGQYHLSSMFKSENYDFNLFMIGTRVQFF